MNDLIGLNERGIFPGPSEDREQFFKRALAAKPRANSHPRIFGAAPDWVDIQRGRKGLRPWEGAATWIDESADGLRTAMVQIKSSGAARLYPQDEVVAHEMVHAMRLMFDERRFEEILAFRTSQNRFRRYFGPLFTRPAETLGFVLWMLVSWLVYWAELILDVSLGASYVLFSSLLPLGWGVWRLVRSQRIFSLALKHLDEAIPGQSLALALRLTDGEIERFAASTAEEICAFAAKEKESSLRWEQLFSAYFS